LLNFLSNPQVHNPTKTPEAINPRQMGKNPPQMETTHKTQNDDTKTENTDQEWIQTKTTRAIQKTIICNFSNTSFTKGFRV
jgi:hypothetical protein